MQSKGESSHSPVIMRIVAIRNDVIIWNTTTVQVTTLLEFEMEPHCHEMKNHVVDVNKWKSLCDVTEWNNTDRVSFSFCGRGICICRLESTSEISRRASSSREFWVRLQSYRGCWTFSWSPSPESPGVATYVDGNFSSATWTRKFLLLLMPK